MEVEFLQLAVGGVQALALVGIFYRLGHLGGRVSLIEQHVFKKEK